MRLMFLISLFIVLLSTPLAAQPNTIRPVPSERGDIGQILHAVENYACAFMRHRSSDQYVRIHVSMSRDGTTWINTNYPDYKVLQLLNTSGCGICGSTDGRKLNTVFNDKRGGIYIAEGSVSGDSVNWSTSTNHIMVNRADSAPSCVLLPNGLLLIAVRSGDSMIVHMYIDGNQFIGAATPSRYNANTLGRPSIATCGGITLMAWQRENQDTNRFDIILAQGEMIQQGPISTFSFNKYGQLNLVEDNVVPSATKDPVLATDGKHFYLAVIQEERGAGAGTLHGWQIILYKSLGTDLYEGWEVSGRIPLNVHNKTYINLAATQVGTLVAAKIRDLPEGNNELQSKFFSNGTWQDIGDSPWLNEPSASYRQFGLTRFGINAPFHPEIPGLRPAMRD